MGIRFGFFTMFSALLFAASAWAGELPYDKTAFVRRPDEWGPGGPPDPNPNPACTLAVDGFAELAERLGAPAV